MKYRILFALLAIALLPSCTSDGPAYSDVIDTGLVMLDERQIACAQQVEYSVREQLEREGSGRIAILTHMRCDETQLPSAQEGEGPAASRIIQVQGFGSCATLEGLASSDYAEASSASCGDISYHEAFYDGVLRDVCLRIGDEILVSEKRFFADMEGTPGPGSCRWLSAEELAQEYAQASAMEG